MTSTEEAAFVRGYRASLVGLLRHCISELGYDDASVTDSTRWIIEREEAVAALRSVCRDHGDNEWDEKLHLRDVIEKHLARHL